MGETGLVMPQAAPVSPPAPSTPSKPKGKVGIWIGILLIIVGIVLGIALVVAGARSLLSGFDDLQRVPINGGGVVRIDDVGTQTIYAERPTTQGGSGFSTNTYSTFAPDVAVRVIGPDGTDVPVNRGGSSEEYHYDGREGVKIGSFYASSSGTYRIVSRGQDGLGQGSWNSIAVGTGLEWSGIGAILGGVFGGGLVVLIGIIVLIISAIRRSRSKKQGMQAPAYPGAYGGGGPGWPAAPGYAAPGVGGYGAAPGGYGTPPAPGGYATPPAPGAAGPGWVPPPVPVPGQQGPGPTWTPPPAPAPQAPPAQPGPSPWETPAAPWQTDATAPPAPSWPPSAAEQPGPERPAVEPPAADPVAGEPESPAGPPAGDPLAPPWQPPSPGGDSGSAS